MTQFIFLPSTSELYFFNVGNLIDKMLQWHNIYIQRRANELGCLLLETSSILTVIKSLGTLSKKKRYYLGIFPNMGRGVFPNPKTFVNLPSIFYRTQVSLVRYMGSLVPHSFTERPFADLTDVTLADEDTTESEKPWQRGSIAIRKVFANPESFCNKAYICSKMSGWQGNRPDG